MKKLFKILIFIAAVPIIASLIIKPEPVDKPDEENDTDVISLPFSVIIEDDKGAYQYTPEGIIPYMVNALASRELLSEFEDTVNPTAKRQEYLKALSIVCRSNLIYIWEQQGRPERLDICESGLYIKNYGDAQKFDEAESAAEATLGAVITNADSEKGAVIAAPFYTTNDWDITIGIAGKGDGLSLNYAVLLAREGKDFYSILNYFYKNMQITIFDVN